jgi:hypothetical protein
MRTEQYFRFLGWLREDSVFRRDRGWQTPKITARLRPCTDYQIELLDAQKRVLTTASPELDKGGCSTAGGRMKSRRVLAYLPIDTDGVLVRFRKGDQIIDERALATSAPKVAWRSVNVVNDVLQLEWTTEHSEPVLCDIAAMQGTRGARLADRLSSTEAVIPLTHIPFAGDCHVAVLASDGLRSGTAVSEVIRLPTRLPEVVIMRPLANEVFSEIEVISFLGHAISIDGRSLPDASLRWTVDGREVTRGKRMGWINGLQPGTHIIELSCEDSHSRREIAVRAASSEEERWRKMHEQHASSTAR